MLRLGRQRSQRGRAENGAAGTVCSMSTAHRLGHGSDATRPLIPSGRGLFVTFEGIEGSGKSTLSRSVLDELIRRALPVRRTFEPGDTALGAQLRPLLLNDTVGVRTAALLFAADRAHHVDHVIVPALAGDELMLCDRFETSSVVYQGIWRELGAENVRTLSRFASASLLPDMVVWCKLDPAVAAARRDSHPDALDEAATRDADLIAAGFAAEVARDPSRFFVVDATAPVEALTALIADAIEQRWAARQQIVRMTTEPGRLVLISGPSGAGKNSVLDDLLSLTGPRPRWYSVSVTTRTCRSGEVDGRDYRFVDDDTFEELLASGGLLEHAVFTGARYGTPADPIQQQRAAGTDVIALVELSGVRQIKAAIPDAIVIFLIPPSLQALEQRLRARGTETDEQIARRLAAAAREMIEGPQLADYVICNDDVRSAAARIARIIEH